MVYWEKLKGANLPSEKSYFLGKVRQMGKDVVIIDYKKFCILG
jgi:hypothetical protein